MSNSSVEWDRATPAADEARGDGSVVTRCGDDDDDDDGDNDDEAVTVLDNDADDEGDDGVASVFIDGDTVQTAPPPGTGSLMHAWR